MEESPGDLVIFQGEHFKEYRGMGSVGAMQTRGFARDRYAQNGVVKTVPEGIEGRVRYRGKLSEVVYQLVGGLRAGMHYAGVRTIPEMKARTRFIRISPAGAAGEVIRTTWSSRGKRRTTRSRRSYDLRAGSLGGGRAQHVAPLRHWGRALSQGERGLGFPLARE